jgi:DNA-binding response OmpR family regulator
MSQPRPGSVAARLTATTTVVVVEDEHDIAEFVAAYLRTVGFAVHHVDATSAAEAKKQVVGHKPAAILLDIHLRGFSGLDVYRLLRSDPAMAAVPVIVVSADNRSLTRTTVERMGIDAFIPKPFDPRTLHEVIEERIAGTADLHGVSVTDDVTGVFTAGYMQDRLADEIALIARQGGTSGFALLRVLGTREARALGQAVEEYVLREVGRRLIDLLPEGTIVARSAEEFSVLAPGHDTPALARRMLALQPELTQPITLPGGGVVEIRIAAGCASHPTDASDEDELFMAADAALADAVDDGGAVRAAVPELRR